MQDLLRSVSNSYPEFSSGQKKVGDLFFKEPIFLAFSSALEVGRRVNVSESTVIRWTQKLGYTGYAEFQQVVQRKLAEERLEKAEQKIPEPVADQSFLENLLDADISSIVKLKKTIKEDQLLKVVDRISQADRIYVTGNFFDYGIAHWFSNWLNLALDHTEMMYSSTGEYYTQLSKMAKGDLVIAFVFPRYSRMVIDTLKSAKSRGADVIVLTDSADSPALAYADHVLTVSVNTNLNIDSYTSVHALLTSIMRFVYVKEQAKVNANLAKVEAVYKERNIFM
ncbi:DNA-binding MurR/RpiR family transcriptional regulator [Planomicrobium stackebrandtii]|uniref:DNA-binding MurR/RpiR family transcriptional regulator n=1 Tax=Planomicrobium stackebrandtii TaxID=253160 RepID=A0ABU0GT78_9BACL|nr:MurR/RpiR family transcriptional regulator [Planomicrobium stackebrandtii]MDQ0427971.1 DNA-binding MurR/RpiR family transcriptional regulator [Planomicrobium stackebrandtii]